MCGNEDLFYEIIVYFLIIIHPTKWGTDFFSVSLRNWIFPLLFFIIVLHLPFLRGKPCLICNNLFSCSILEN